MKMFLHFEYIRECVVLENCGTNENENYTKTDSDIYTAHDRFLIIWERALPYHSCLELSKGLDL
jgi:uncharacterized protein (UPF0248 family)